jgi:hypothetical protein
MHSSVEISCYFDTSAVAGTTKSNLQTTRSSSRIAEESSNGLADDLVDVAVRSTSMDLTPVPKVTTDNQEDKVESLIDSKSTASPGPNNSEGNDGECENGSTRNTRKRGANNSSSKVPVSRKPRKEKGKAAEETTKKGKVIAAEETLVTLLATDNSGLTVGRAIVHRYTTVLHGNPVPEDCQVITVVEAKLEKYRLPFPNLSNHPPQKLLGDAKGTLILWPSAYVGNLQ